MLLFLIRFFLSVSQSISLIFGIWLLILANRNDSKSSMPSEMRPKNQREKRIVPKNDYECMFFSLVILHVRKFHCSWFPSPESNVSRILLFFCFLLFVCLCLSLSQLQSCVHVSGELACDCQARLTCSNFLSSLSVISH